MVEIEGWDDITSRHTCLENDAVLRAEDTHPIATKLDMGPVEESTGENVMLKTYPEVLYSIVPYVQNEQAIAKAYKASSSPSHIFASANRRKVYLSEMYKVLLFVDCNLLFVYKTGKDCPRNPKVYAFLCAFTSELVEPFGLDGRFTLVDRLTQDVVEQGKIMAATEELLFITPVAQKRQPVN